MEGAEAQHTVWRPALARGRTANSWEGVQSSRDTLGEKFGLAGENAFENAQLANVVDAAMDLLQELGIAWFEKDEDRKQKATKKLKEESIPTKLKQFGKRVAGNENGLLTGKPTWADFFLYMTLDFVMMTAGNEVLKDYPGTHQATGIS